ncbi:MAG: hypothetical protein OEY51_04030 [Cyclobacteriaceae bacterium]|nr:hypothetical protein [Cyclobacteriaceae bacterium]
MKNAKHIFIAASILAGIMLNTNCNITGLYDVRGTWEFTGNYNGIDFDKTLTFSGDKTRGTVADEINGVATFTSDGHHINFDLSIICFCQKTWRGYFVDKDNMEGTLNGCSSGTWTASRN